MPEQIWDGPDLPSSYLRVGGTTDAAMPLLWAHSEYVKLHRSAADRKVFDLIEPAYDRYVRGNGERKTLEVWKSNRQVQIVSAGHASANPSELSVSVALDQRRLATLGRCEVTRNSDWN